MNKLDAPRPPDAAVPWRPGNVAAAALSCLLCACGAATAPTQFHTLMQPATTAPASTVGVTDWQLLPVKVPAQVDQPQWVLRAADGSLVVLEQQRWIAPLADEIHAALVERLTKALGPPAASPAAGGAAASTRVAVDVRRFELAAGREARLEADWQIRRADAAVACHSTFVQQPTGPGYVELAAAQQRAVGQLGDAISKALERLDKGQPGAC